LKETKKIDFTIPPHDGNLVNHTLWPEMNKLYAHPHELESTRVMIVNSWPRVVMAQKGGFKHHNLEHSDVENTQDHFSVYSMEFSSKGKYFTSAPKGRKLALFDESFELIFSYEAHSRAIPGVSISLNKKFLVTGSRDKKSKFIPFKKRSRLTSTNLSRSLQLCPFANSRECKM
jgi:WD40 repeat protein